MGTMAINSPNPYLVDPTDSRFTQFNNNDVPGDFNFPLQQGLYRNGELILGGNGSYSNSTFGKENISVNEKTYAVGDMISFGNSKGYIIGIADKVALVQYETPLLDVLNTNADASTVINKALLVFGEGDVDMTVAAVATLASQATHILLRKNTDFYLTQTVTSDPRTWSDISISTKLYENKFTGDGPLF